MSTSSDTEGMATTSRTSPTSLSLLCTKKSRVIPQAMKSIPDKFLREESLTKSIFKRLETTPFPSMKKITKK